jgi:hypothetical protein
MSKKDLIQALCDYFGIEVEGYYVTDENVESILKSYDFISGAYLWYRWPRFSLWEVVKALEGFCDD